MPKKLQELSKASNAVITVFGKPWIQFFIMEDKLYCIHEAETEEAKRGHAKCGNFPINSVEETTR